MDFAWSKGCGGGAEVPRDKSPDGSPAEMPLRCHQSGLPRYLLRDAFKFICVKEPQSLSVGFLSGSISNFFHDNGSLSLGFLFGSLENAPVPHDSPATLVGFLSGDVQNLVVGTSGSDDGSVTPGFLSGLLFNAVEIADESGSPDVSIITLGFQTGTLFDVVLTAPMVTESESESVGFSTGALTTIAIPVSHLESSSYSVGFQSGSLV